jgi:hypothetical protein
MTPQPKTFSKPTQMYVRTKTTQKLPTSGDTQASGNTPEVTSVQKQEEVTSQNPCAPLVFVVSI